LPELKEKISGDAFCDTLFCCSFSGDRTTGQQGYGQCEDGALEDKAKKNGEFGLGALNLEFNTVTKYFNIKL